MMDLKASADVSSYILFEATADSEALFDPTMDQIPMSDEDDDDDAQSCTYGGSETRNGYEFCDADGDLHDVKKEEEEEEVYVYGTSYYDHDADDDDHRHHNQERQKSNVPVDSGPELIDEMEKSRKFWEACLAS